MSNLWAKIDIKLWSDTKLRGRALWEKGLWVGLILEAKKDEYEGADPGLLEGFTDRVVRDTLCPELSVRKVTAALNFFESKKMLKRTLEGGLYLDNYLKRQSRLDKAGGEEPKGRLPTGVLYFMQDSSTGFIRPGLSENPWARCKELGKKDKTRNYKVISTCRDIPEEFARKIRSEVLKYEVRDGWCKPPELLAKQISSKVFSPTLVTTRSDDRSDVVATSDYDRSDEAPPISLSLRSSIDLDRDLDRDLKSKSNCSVGLRPSAARTAPKEATRSEERRRPDREKPSSRQPRTEERKDFAKKKEAGNGPRGSSTPGMGSEPGESTKIARNPVSARLISSSAVRLEPDPDTVYPDPLQGTCEGGLPEQLALMIENHQEEQTMPEYDPEETKARLKAAGKPVPEVRESATTVPNERLAQGRAAAEMSATRTQAQVAKNAERDARRGRKRSTTKPTTTTSYTDMALCESTWLAEWRKAFSDLEPPKMLGGPERGQFQHLLKQYSLEIVTTTIMYVLRNWPALNKKVFKGEASLPTLGMIVKLSGKWCQESQMWAKYLPVMGELAAVMERLSKDPFAEDLLTLEHKKAKEVLRSLGLL